MIFPFPLVGYVSSTEGPNSQVLKPGAALQIEGEGMPHKEDPLVNLGEILATSGYFF